MTIETTYYADDGTEFDTEAECLEYENKLKHALDGIVFFDEGFKVCKDLDTAARESIYAVVKDEEKTKVAFEWIEKEYGHEMPSIKYVSGDILVFDDCDGEWYNLSNKLYNLQRLHRNIFDAYKSC